MKTAIAILTYNRREALDISLSGVEDYCGNTSIGIFDDVSNRDDTVGWLLKRYNIIEQDLISEKKYRASVARKIGKNGKIDLFLGNENLGVAGNSNRAIHWFMTETDADHLCLLNDDVKLFGDFTEDYLEAHNRTGIQLFCMCDFEGTTYRCINTKYLGVNLKVVLRFTGIMMSMTRKLVEDIGYYDMQFGKFGEEHCDYTIRARFSGAIKINGRDINCADINLDKPKIRHQEGVKTSVFGDSRLIEDKKSQSVMSRVVSDYSWRGVYRDYRLTMPEYAGFSASVGIPALSLYMQGTPFVRER